MRVGFAVNGFCSVAGNAATCIILRKIKAGNAIFTKKSSHNLVYSLQHNQLKFSLRKNPLHELHFF
jgi:hypothetical protein